MKTKTIELYEFSELSEEAKSTALAELRDVNVDGDYWYDYDGKTGFTAKELKRMKVAVKDAPDELIAWDKLYFDTGRSWYIQFTEAQFKDNEIARKFLRVPRDLWDQVYWSIQNSRENTTFLSYESQAWDKEFTKKQTEILDRAVELFAEKMEEALRGLRDSYEYAITDEAIIETIECNEYAFTVDGKIESL